MGGGSSGAAVFQGSLEIQAFLAGVFSPVGSNTCLEGLGCFSFFSSSSLRLMVPEPADGFSDRYRFG